ncbi:olfactory receptor class A-like protein 4 isoform X1 [Danio rerio]|uniref:Olfactory receptor class A-like protein 4 isoform X1 n=1 Tax=Danio rerio TaxID=7955 RepID=A0A8M3AUC1_DANRE|nr:C-X-C chemokine receptor type 3 isoform X1 [Danio rerio]|eukprot:XP_009294044.1 C-X-C chemokine receptor type 3 isoform X1 [Danio rerio]
MAPQKKPVNISQRITSSPFYIMLYVVLVLLGNAGNTTVIAVVGQSLLQETGTVRSSDVILVNMAFSNLMVSLLRNTVLMVSDLGVEIFLSRDMCQFMMGLWVWVRSANVWSTFFLSAFHFQTLRRVAPPVINLHGPRGPPLSLILGFCLIWSLNLIYSIPAFIFSKNGNENSTEGSGCPGSAPNISRLLFSWISLTVYLWCVLQTLMLVSSTTRPLLGCIWDFPSAYSGLAFATSSMILHESIPICLMNITNLGSLCTLYAHGHKRTVASQGEDAPVVSRIPAERRAAKVILALNILFISSWGTNVISVNYFNYNRGQSTEFLLIIARFVNMSFIAFSPIILAVGHRKLRAFIKSVLSHMI